MEIPSKSSCNDCYRHMVVDDKRIRCDFPFWPESIDDLAVGHIVRHKEYSHDGAEGTVNKVDPHRTNPGAIVDWRAPNGRGETNCNWGWKNLTVIGYKHIAPPEPQLPEIGSWRLSLCDDGSLEFERDAWMPRKIQIAWMKDFMKVMKILNDVDSTTLAIKFDCESISFNTIRTIHDAMKKAQEKA